MEDLNIIAVIAGTVIAFLVGWLWYSPKLFGEKWAIGSKVDLGAASGMPAFAMIAQLLALLCLALVIGLTAQIDALGTAILAILAAALFVTSNGAFSGKDTYAKIVDFGYVIVAGIVMIACQGIL